MLAAILLLKLLQLHLIHRTSGVPVPTAPTSSHDINANRSRTNSNYGIKAPSSLQSGYGITPTTSERKVQYKPRNSARRLTGTPREQVSQFTYRLRPKQVNESEEIYQIRKNGAIARLDARKKIHLEKIQQLEKESNGKDITSQYNEWVQKDLDNKNLKKARIALGRPDMTIEEYTAIRREKEKEDEELGPEFQLKKEQTAFTHRKKRIAKELESGDVKKRTAALERMQKYGIEDLGDRRGIGAKKGALRRALDKDPDNKVLREKAMELGMDLNYRPRIRRQIEGSRLEEASSSSQDKRQKVAEDNFQKVRTSYTRDKGPPSFDLNEVPPVDDEMD
jgi:hypothetical protein